MADAQSTVNMPEGGNAPTEFEQTGNEQAGGTGGTSVPMDVGSSAPAATAKSVAKAPPPPVPTQQDVQHAPPPQHAMVPSAQVTESASERDARIEREFNAQTEVNE